MNDPQSLSSQSLNFVAHLHAEAWSQLRATGETESIKRGDFLFRAGGNDNSIYILHRGRVKIFQLSAKGKETLLWFCAAGEIFGISELCRGGSRKVYAQACEDSEIVVIPRDAFKAFVAQRPDTALHVIEVLSYRLRNLSKIVEGLATTDVPQRVKMLLATLSERYGQRVGDSICIDIGITHQEMADMIGTTRQSVTSTLGELKRAGLVQQRRRRLHVSPLLLNGASLAAEHGALAACSPRKLS